MSAHPLKAPFPYFGGKSRVADEVWRRFGQVDNYIEPFAGSCAVLLARPGWRPGLGLREVVNDADGLVANFWRALRYDPDSVVEHADWPISEIDLHARHRWLCGQREVLTAQLIEDPEWYDARAAGWWAWGASCWLGNGWGTRANSRQTPTLSPGVCGVFRANGMETMRECAARMKHVRVAAGDWSRVVTSCIIGLSQRPNNGVHVAAIFLDPPYDEGVSYAAGGGVSRDVWDWAVEHGGDRRLRIAVCGYDDGGDVPDGWSVHAWATKGGYGSHGYGRGRENKHRERVWFSPGCLSGEEGQPPLFAEMAS